MGKRKHNAKGREVKAVIIDNSETKKVFFTECDNLKCVANIVVLVIFFRLN